jgi:hypothetical protein
MGDPRPSPDRILQLATGACGTGILASGFSARAPILSSAPSGAGDLGVPGAGPRDLA